MIYNANQFFQYFDELLDVNESIPEYVTTTYPRFTTHNINGTNIGIEDIIEIVKNMKENKRVGFEGIPILREYLYRTMDLIDDYKSDTEHSEFIYGYGRGLPEDEDFPAQVTRLEQSMEYLINDILRALSGDITKLFRIVTPGQEVSLIQLEQQGIPRRDSNRRLRLPREVIQYEIKPFIAKVPKGGKKTNKKRKSNKIRKNKTKHRR